MEETAGCVDLACRNNDLDDDRKGDARRHHPFRVIEREHKEAYYDDHTRIWSKDSQSAPSTSEDDGDDGGAIQINSGSDNSEGLSDDEMDNSTTELQVTEDCLEDEVDDGKTIPKVCSFSKFPNHPHRSRRQHCGSQLLRAAVTKDGEHKFYPLTLWTSILQYG
eukprot:Em0001g2610a